MRSALGVGRRYLSVEHRGASELRQSVDRWGERVSSVESVPTVDAGAALAVEDCRGAVPVVLDLVQPRGGLGRLGGRLA